MTDWTETELSALRRAYASGTTRVSYDGKSINYGSDAELANAISDLETRIATATTGTPRRRRWGTVASKGL